jgi:ABC-2 type transport system ATP-binding protein
MTRIEETPPTEVHNAESPVAIQITDLVVNYGPKPALAGLSLTVPTGSIFGCLGPNGAGKTSIIKTLLGFRRPDGGSAQVLGLDILRSSTEIRSRVGYVSEMGSLYDGLNTDQMGDFFHSTARRWQQPTFERFVKKFELPRRVRVGRLSRGMKMQLAFALAMGSDPELLILDEPTAGLDPLARRALLGTLVTEVAALGKTVFFSSHNLAEVESVADSVAILRDGRLLLSGDLDTLKQRHKVLRLGYASPPTAPQLADLERLPGVSELVQDGRTLRLSVQGSVQGDVPELIRRIQMQQPAPQDLDIVDQGLEELYLALMRRAES